MDELINKLITEYNAGSITWHDIQDIVEAKLIIQAGGTRAYEDIPIRDRAARENEILEKIERRISKC